MAPRAVPCLLLLASTIACASTVSSIDAAVSAPDAPDAPDAPVAPNAPVAPDAPDAGACVAPRSCVGAAVTPAVLAGVCPGPAGTLRAEVRSADVTFCRCLHGAGPGVEATIAIEVANAGPRAVTLGTEVSLALTPIDGGAALALGPCCTRILRRPYTCAGEASPWRGVVAPGHVDALAAELHVDAPAVAVGRYRVALTVTVDGAPLTLDLGERTVTEQR